jgi:hypothetical protein
MLININFKKNKELQEEICENLFKILSGCHPEINTETQTIIISCFKKDTDDEKKKTNDFKNKFIKN